MFILIELSFEDLYALDVCFCRAVNKAGWLDGDNDSI